MSRLNEHNKREGEATAAHEESLDTHDTETKEKQDKYAKQIKTVE